MLPKGKEGQSMAKRIGWVALLLAVLALPAMAQAEKGMWEFSPMIGYSGHGNEISSGFMGAFSAGYNFTDAWGLEFQLGYGDAEFDDRNYDAQSVRFSALRSFRTDKFWEPYLKMGLGFVAYRSDSFADAFEGDKQAHLGFGLRHHISPRVAFRVEALAKYCFDTEYPNEHENVVMGGSSLRVPKEIGRAHV